MGRSRIKKGDVYGPYTVVYASMKRDKHDNYLYNVECKCGKKYRVSNAFLGNTRAHGVTGCKSCRTPTAPLIPGKIRKPRPKKT